MTNQQQLLITPPDELVEKWGLHWEWSRGSDSRSFRRYIADQASRWGWEQRGAATEAELQQAADQELDACCEWLNKSRYGASLAVNGVIEQLRAARRPEARSEAESALNALEHILRHSQTDHGANTIRLALERLKELEVAND